MNERLASIGGQLKGAVTKITVTWKEQEPKRKRFILIIAAAVLALAVGIVIFLNVRSNRYVSLYDTMPPDEVTRAAGFLESAETPIPVRINNGKLEVPSKSVNRAMAILAVQGLPTTTLDYSIMDAAGGLTTTEFEKNTAWVHQQQNRLQDTIKTYEGVQNAIVTLNLKQDSNRVWDSQATTPTGAVSVTMKPGVILGEGQVSGIRHMVSGAVGIAPEDVTVTDGATGELLAGAGQAYDPSSSMTKSFLERMDLEKAVEEDLKLKAANMLSLTYPDASRYRISCTVRLDTDAMVTEIKEYDPETIALDEEEIDAVLGMAQFAEGVVGETDNTDVPIYVDYDGDGNADSVDFHRYRDYAVSYVMRQITKDGASMAQATMGVAVDDTANNDKMQGLRATIANATGLELDNVTVTPFLIEPVVEPETPPWYADIFGEDFNPLILYIIIAAVVALILVLILVLVLRSKAKKKRLALEMAAAEAEAEEAERIQREIEERKNQLKNAAFADQKDNAITEEVREFARQNPEITANLLRNWLKEGD